jgi:hypothetical protein
VKYDPDEYVDYISRDMAKELFNELEKTKGLFTDVSEIGKEVDRREFSRNWSLMFEKDKDDFFEDNHEFSPEFRKISDSIKNKGNNSIIWLLQDFLMQRFPDIIKNGTKFDSNRNLAKFLKNIDRRELTSFKKKDEAKKALNKASPDQKKDFSVDYRKALIEYERDVKILAGAIEFLSPETLLADYFRRKISKIQKMLVSSKSERHNAKFFLDGTPVPELDRNTGIISGDCTADRPLPFREPSIPIFNVKFLNREKKHIGNIYLLKKNR